MSAERERLHNLFPNLDFDPTELREKYRFERERRIRDDGEDQYIEAASEFAHYADDDPYADSNYDRAPLDLDIDVAIIGAGFSGLMAAARLKEKGVTNFRIIEAGPGIGTVTPVRNATSSRTAISPCWKRRASCRRKSTRLHLRYTNTFNVSETTSTCTTARFFKPG
jgi:hypothetical protein